MANESTSMKNPVNIPQWITPSLFEPVFRSQTTGFRSIKTFDAKGAISPGENYATIMLRITADVELTGKSVA